MNLLVMVVVMNFCETYFFVGYFYAIQITFFTFQFIRGICKIFFIIISVRATCKLRGDGDSKESEQSIKTKYNSKKLEKQGGSSNNEIKE